MISKVIFIIESHYNKRDHKRFGVEILLNNGFDVAVWDFRRVFYRKLPSKLEMPDYFEYSNLKKVNSKKEAKNLLSLLKKNVLLIPRFGGWHEKLWLYRLMRKLDLNYAVLSLIPGPGMKLRGDDKQRTIGKLVKQKLVNQKFKIALTLKEKKALGLANYVFYYIRARIIPQLPLRLLGISAASIWFVAGESALKLYKLPTDESTEIMWLHAYDYELYMEENQKNAKGKEEYAVFLDQYLPFHSDWTTIGEDPLIMNAEKYFRSLRKFFNYIEVKLGIEVRIAAHPRSHYSEKDAYFGKRQTVVGNTVQMVRNSTLVIAHDTTAINFAVLYEKPMIFVINNAIVKQNRHHFTYNTAAHFGKKPLFIDDEVKVDFDAVLKVSKCDYERYKNDFIKKAGSEEKPAWQIVADKLKSFDSERE